MQIFKHTVWIARPREVVFDYFTNWEAAPEWRMYVRTMTPEPAGDVRAGSKLRVVLDIAGDEYTYLMTVLACERPSLWRHRTNERDFDGHVEYRFETENGGTRVTFAMIVKPRTVYGWLGLPLMWLGRGKTYRDQLPALKRQLEAHA
jgi:uncharacterized protein YndB with AHSA1/START domain